MKKTISALFVAASCTIGASAAHASNCGDTAAGTYNLTNDLTCSGDGLVVVASNTTIQMNGHTITCVGSGFAGSCQTMTTGGGGFTGIASNGFDNVTVNGKGTVSGFRNGISLVKGKVLTVDNVLVTGPSALKILTNNKTVAVGIYIAQSSCTLSTL